MNPLSIRAGSYAGRGMGFRNSARVGTGRSGNAGGDGSGSPLIVVPVRVDVARVPAACAVAST
jgi:hypothetical protein